MLILVYVIGLGASPFPIRMERSKDVTDLKRAIFREPLFHDASKHTFAIYLILYKVNIPNGEDVEKLVPQARKEKLPGTHRLSRIFPEDPPPETISILVELPSGLPSKRSRDAGDSPDSQQRDLKRLKLATAAPSVISKQDDYELMQRQPSQRLLDDRPQPDQLPPISLLFEGFGHFMDTLRHTEDTLTLMERRDLEIAVDAFADEMVRFHDDRDERREVGLWTLNKILSLGHCGTLTASRIGSVCSEGHYNGPHQAASCMVMFENELVNITSDPVVELTSYVAHSHMRGISCCPEVFESWRAPSLGLTIVGPYVTFYGMILLHRWHIVALTPTLSCMPCAQDGGGRKALYTAFYAALNLLRDIDVSAGARVANPPFSNQTFDYTFPYISTLPKYNSSSNGEIRFRIRERLIGDRLLYTAEDLDTAQIILLKFTRHYSIELHALCASRGRAPCIFGFGRLPGGWFAIAMEYLHLSLPPSRSPFFTHLVDKWSADLQELVQAFHDENLVHGDLRESNILCDDQDTPEVKLVDFDWGGKEGEAYYPTARLCLDLIDGRDRDDLRITKDDDRRILENTLGDLKRGALQLYYSVFSGNLV